jgi:hypothetical protein
VARLVAVFTRFITYVDSVRASCSPRVSCLIKDERAFGSHMLARSPSQRLYAMPCILVAGAVLSGIANPDWR